MKHSIKAVLAWAAVAVVLVGCNSQPTAEEVLRKSYQKCQSIQEGHYEMSRRMKYMSGNDTTLSRYTCDFKKLPDDTIYGKAFNYFQETWDPDNGSWDSGWSYHFLYTGNEYASFDDSTGTLMPCDLWAADIIRERHNRTFYTTLATKSCYPIPNEKSLTDSTYSYSLSETRLDGKSCYLVDILCPVNDEPDTVFGMQNLRYEINLWIDKKDYLPLQYAIAFDVLEQQDTMCQYEECRLVDFRPVADASKLTLESIPAEVTLKDYEPYKEPEPLPEGSPAPDWSLPTLTGDTIRLADLKGKVVLLDFFYKSCAPCCAAMPVLQSLHEKYKDKGFVMLGIDPIDDPVKDEMADFLAKRDITYTVLFSERELYHTYQVWLFPTLFFLDREGKIAKTHHGFSKDMEEELEADLVKLLEK
jgi:peroxiredoxin